MTMDERAVATIVAAFVADGLIFSAPGTYPFHCAIHSQMKGTITIVP